MYGRSELSSYKPIKAGEKVRVWTADGSNGCFGKTELNDNGLMCVRFIEDAAAKPHGFREKEPANIKGMLIPVAVLLAFADIEKI
jgi:hypothetical protein